ncbi:MAG TPA: single-stranded DNA-binding protein, partial [Lachnospiraceae bacterium]
AFGKNGEFTEKYLKKGMKMAVHGHLRSSKVQNEDGSVAYYVNMVVDEFEFAQSKQESKKMANEENADLVEDYQNYDDFSFR